MGKAEDEHAVPPGVGPQSPDQNEQTQWCGGGGYGNCGFGWCFGGVRRLIGLRCLFVLLFATAAFLSAIFWLPPFLQFADQRDPDLDPKFKDHDIVASFYLKKPFYLLEDNISQLKEDIWNEIGFPTTKVVILSLEYKDGSNTTKVVFGVDPDAKYSEISRTIRSLIRESFVSLVLRLYSLRLTTTLFGEPFLFEVLKFPGGITIIPYQRAFLLQKVQILFNFTLNFSIYEIQSNFDELRSQLKSGLHLAPYENLYVSLSNSKGSTVAAPTVVQSSVVLAVGNTPSTQRLKQLAQTITGSHSRNLGLNNTVFGRVKQVRLSSILQHSLHGGDGSGTSPSPAPLPHPHHNHHHHHHHRDTHLAPAISPAPSIERGVRATPNGAPTPRVASPDPKRSVPAPEKSYGAKPPGCQLGNGRSSKGYARKHPHLAPTVAPYISHYPAASPQVQVVSPAPISHTSPASSPLPSVVFAHVQPPSKSESDLEHSDSVPQLAPSPSPSSYRIASFNWANWRSSASVSYAKCVLHIGVGSMLVLCV
ncbi:hypothetical protein F2P56_009788 [Juglans regia]|uniref:Uncharacterized protein LOC109019002 isoform X2 n=2 Tax=Juglans regia TaxID=51240 RepID=A0A2I4HKY1_JUGRE|nr:uncharacterized protein LOC109019002 isoform X2 [Juglans regia]KAF5473161.1 hypothetical protein F2P56_009788 [Juglans regia]